MGEVEGRRSKLPKTVNHDTKNAKLGCRPSFSPRDFYKPIALNVNNK